MKNNQDTFFFYDYETFGINPAKDRISQFAGIRTDMDLNIIDEPMMMYCTQSPDYLPSPEAVLITGITPQICQEKGIPEPEFANIIFEQLNIPNTCSLGYNTIRFDEEMTRYLFYRNFFDPYAHTWKNNNSRWDLIDLVRACYALRPEGINWPMTDENLPSFKLEALTEANNISHENAHDAMSDVYATIKMAKLIKEKHPKLFTYFFMNRRAKTLIPMIDLKLLTPLVHISGMFGAKRSNCSIIAPLAYQENNKNALICIDLMGDISGLIKLSAEQIHAKLYTSTIDLAENESRIPLKNIHLNKCPIIAEIKTLPKDLSKLDINPDIYQKNYECLLENKDLIINKALSVFNQITNYSESDIEGRLYGSFFNSLDSQNMAKFRTLPISKLACHGLYFQDSRIEDLIFLYRAKHFPSNLSDQEVKQWHELCLTRLNNQKNDFFIALNEAKEKYKAQTDKVLLLQQLEQYVNHLLLI